MREIGSDSARIGCVSNPAVVLAQTGGTCVDVSERAGHELGCFEWPAGTATRRAGEAGPVIPSGLPMVLALMSASSNLAST